MTNTEAARILARLATMLEILGANPFRVRAYREAARVVEAQGEPVAALAAEEGALEALPGIGSDLAQKIREIVETGSTPLYDELRTLVPPHALVPLGFNIAPDYRSMVPHYASGLPMAMAPFEVVFGRDAVFLVVPLLGGVVVTEHTYRLTQSYFTFTPLGEVSVKGRHQPVQAYGVAGLGRVRTRMQAAAKTGTLGVGCTIIAVAVHFGGCVARRTS